MSLFNKIRRTFSTSLFLDLYWISLADKFTSSRIWCFLRQCGINTEFHIFAVLIQKLLCKSTGTTLQAPFVSQNNCYGSCILNTGRTLSTLQRVCCVEVLNCHFLSEKVPHFHCRCQLIMNTSITDTSVYDISIDWRIELSVIHNVGVLTTFHHPLHMHLQIQCVCVRCGRFSFCVRR
jgi:hypothetical protein